MTVVAATMRMADRPKILLLDDDQDLLDMYREMLTKLPSNPEIHTATSGARAISLLDSQSFGLLVSDLNMPKMDGLQVLTIVRRKFPHLRTAVMTAVVDAQFRARAYAMGIDLFLEKPSTPQEVELFMDCVESLLGREADAGFRGVQSKSLMDIIQLECLSQSSSVLKITNGSLVGRIWFSNGAVIDAETGDLKAEGAFHRILSWKTGAFEIMPPDAKRVRTIHCSHHSLLLESAQAQDEAAGVGTGVDPENTQSGGEGSLPNRKRFAQREGVEWAMTIAPGTGETDSWGVEDEQQLLTWVRNTTKKLQTLGDSLGAGPLRRLDTVGTQNFVSVVVRSKGKLCVGLSPSFSPCEARECLEEVIAVWDS